MINTKEIVPKKIHFKNKLLPLVWSMLSSDNALRFMDKSFLFYYSFVQDKKFHIQNNSNANSMLLTISLNKIFYVELYLVAVPFKDYSFLF